MLQLAAAAGPVVGTGGLDPGGGGLQKLDNMRPGRPVANVLDLDDAPLSHNAALDEHRHAADAGHAAAVGGPVFHRGGVAISLFDHLRPLLFC